MLFESFLKINQINPRMLKTGDQELLRETKKNPATTSVRRVALSAKRFGRGFVPLARKKNEPTDARGSYAIGRTLQSHCFVVWRR